ncbi:MAG: ABC transporter permease [Gemmatimonadota bacterium]|jgi:peptide/nickel transport system permease protein|nr:ABC transporter permease [Gemmatimonadota bacterium]|tara:strand:- start:15 stop:1007 length:993 start_codon:yes stop_codon:yes gene_type:complete
MLLLILRRLFWMIPTLVIISIISFAIIQLPPGDYLTSYIAALAESGETVDEEQIEALRMRYALDQPVYVQYFRWIAGMLQGDMGMSFEWNRPVTDLIGERILLTTIISIVTLLVTWGIAVPIGIYSAVKQYSIGDYAVTFIGFIGLATPNFLLALVCMYIGYAVFDVSAGGLFSAAYQNAPWSLAKLWDLFSHIWIPVLVIGTSGTAGMIRVMRGNLLDELRKQYVLTARAKGVHRVKLILKYPVRIALNPMISTIGWVLPSIVSGATITAVVLGLPTTGPLLLRALMNQDMYLAGSMVMMLSLLTVIGTLISDLLLLWLDPRIRYEEQG